MKSPNQRITRAGLLIAAVGLLAACATATPYRAAEHERDYGYQEQKLEQDRYRLSFAGNSSTSRQTVENYLLYRAAELTLEQGKDYFIVIKSDTEKNTEQHSTVVGAPSFHFGYGHHRGYGHHHSYGVGFNVINTNYSDYQAFGVIVLKSGSKPADNYDAYDARQVLENLGVSVVGSQLKTLSSEKK